MIKLVALIFACSSSINGAIRRLFIVDGGSGLLICAADMYNKLARIR